jgi:hypothetical protein
MGYIGPTIEDIAAWQTVHCVWDAEAEVWVATSDDVPGLATGADTLDGLVQKLKFVIPEPPKPMVCCQRTNRATFRSPSSRNCTSWAPRAAR